MSPDSPSQTTALSRSFSELEAAMNRNRPSQSPSHSLSRKAHIIRGMFKVLRRHLESSAATRDGTHQSALETVRDCERLLALGINGDNLAEIQSQLTLLSISLEGNVRGRRITDAVIAALNTIG